MLKKRSQKALRMAKGRSNGRPAVVGFSLLDPSGKKTVFGLFEKENRPGKGGFVGDLLLEK